MLNQWSLLNMGISRWKLLLRCRIDNLTCTCSFLFYPCKVSRWVILIEAEDAFRPRAVFNYSAKSSYLVNCLLAGFFASDRHQRWAIDTMTRSPLRIWFYVRPVVDEACVQGFIELISVFWEQFALNGFLARLKYVPVIFVAYAYVVINLDDGEIVVLHVV